MHCIIKILLSVYIIFQNEYLNIIKSGHLLEMRYEKLNKISLRLKQERISVSGELKRVFFCLNPLKDYIVLTVDELILIDFLKKQRSDSIEWVIYAESLRMIQTRDFDHSVQAILQQIKTD